MKSLARLGDSDGCAGTGAGSSGDPAHGPSEVAGPAGAAIEACVMTDRLGEPADRAVDHTPCPHTPC